MAGEREGKKSEKAIADDERARFFTLLRALFSQRRKTIKNNLSRLVPDKERLSEILFKAGLDEKERAENLRLEDIIRLLRSF